MTVEKWQWYLSAAATREWLRITGRSDDDGGDNWQAAEHELGQLSLTARRNDAATAKQHSGTQVLIGTVQTPLGRVRVECYVRPAARAEGNLPQLVRVRRK